MTETKKYSRIVVISSPFLKSVKNSRFCRYRFYFTRTYFLKHDRSLNRKMALVFENIVIT